MRFSERSAEGVLVAVGAVLQAFCLYMIPLVFECDAAVYFNYSPATTYRAPLFAAFLSLTGQHVFQTFIGTVLVHAVFGVLGPVLVYRILRIAAPQFAFVAALVYALSLVPYTGAKLMLAEQCFTFAVLCTFYCALQFGATRHSTWLYATTVTGLIAMFIRWEGQVIVAGVVVFVIATSRGHAGQWRHVALSLILVLTTVVGWSWVRSVIAQDPAMFGTLQNGTGAQFFWRVYRFAPEKLIGWQQALGIDDGADSSASQRLVDPKNGPATARLHDVIVRIARDRQEDTLFRGARGGFMREMKGDPNRLAADIWANPDDTYVFSIPAEIRSELGTVEADRLLTRVGLEALRAQPAAAVDMAADVAGFLGFLLSPDLLRERRFGAMVMAHWGEFHYANVPFDLGGCATTSLPPRMIAEYKWDQALSRPRQAQFIAIASAMRNWVRNSVGLLFVLTLWAVPLATWRLAGCTMAAVVTVIMIVQGILGGGVQTRYEYAVLPLLLLTTAIALDGILRVSGRLRGRSAASNGVVITNAPR